MSNSCLTQHQIHFPFFHFSNNSKIIYTNSFISKLYSPSSSCSSCFHRTKRFSFSVSDMVAAIPKALVSIANGTEPIEAAMIIDVLRRAEAHVTVASVEEQLQVVASQGVKIVADTLISDCADTTFDLIALPAYMTKNTLFIVAGLVGIAAGLVGLVSFRKLN